MTKCEHWDVGWCCAPTDVKTNAIGKFGVCKLPECCPYLKSQNQMNEIQQTKEDIAILQEKLKKLEELEIQKSKSPAEEAFYRVYGYYPSLDTDGYDGSPWQRFITGYDAGYEEAVKSNKNFEPTPQNPEQVEQGLRDAMKQAKEDGVFDEPKPMDDVIGRLLEKYKSQKLWNMVRNELGYSVDCVNEIVDLVERWIPEEQSAEGSQNTFAIDATEGFNHCLKKIKGMLR